MNMSGKKIFAKLIFVLYIVAVAALCFMHLDNIPSVSTDIFGIPTDKAVHFLMFFPFPLLALAAFGRLTKKPWHSLVFVLIVFFVGCILAMATEIGQGFTTYRTADPDDFRADGIALAISSVIALIIDLRKQFGK